MRARPFALIKGVLGIIRTIFDELYNHFIFFLKGVSYQSFPKINGKIYLVSSKGSVSFGEAVRINSSLKSNPIGGNTKTILFAEPGAYIRIGKNVGISNSAIHAAQEIIIEDDVLIGGNCKIYDTDFHSIKYEDRMRNPDLMVRTSPVCIKKGAFIGAHSIILKGVTIGEKSVIASGSVVTRSVPENELWGEKVNEINIEIIVIDDGSTDKTGELVAQMKKFDSRIVYYRQKNLGVASARNKGIFIAKGKYIMFVDADDTVIVDSITEIIGEGDSKIVQGVQIFPSKQYSASGAKWDVNSRSLLTVCLNRLKYEHSFGGLSPELIQSVHGCYGKFFNRKFLLDNKIKFIDGLGLGEDLLFYMECLKKAQKVTLVDLPIYQISINPFSSTRRFNSLMPGYAMTAIKMIEKEYRHDSDCKNEDVSNAVLDHLAVAVQAYFANTRLSWNLLTGVRKFKKWIMQSKELEKSVVFSAKSIYASQRNVINKDKIYNWLLKSKQFGIYIFIKRINNTIKGR